MKFLFDHNLSPHLARAIAALSLPHNHTVIALRERFPPSTKDADWLTELAKEGGWVVISQDRFKKGSLEKEAIRSSGLITFILKKGWSNHDGWEKAHRLVRWWPRIIQQAEGVTGGAAFYVPLQFQGKGKFEAVQI